MTRKGIVIDLDRCVGCHSCTISCKQENNVPLGAFWNHVLQAGPWGKHPYDLHMYFLPVICQHCLDPECVRACPTGASHKGADGIVLIDKTKCIGCQYCIMACPYGVRYYNKEEGLVEKCTLCAHLVERGEDPACVKTCVGKARFFGDLDDANSAAAKAIAAAGDKVFTLRPDMGTNPTVRYILRKQPWRGGTK